MKPGSDIGEAAPPLAAVGPTEIGLTFPEAEPWAYLINDLVAVASFGIPEMGRTMAGSGPLVFDVSVSDGALQTSVSRGAGDSVEAAVTAEPNSPP